MVFPVTIQLSSTHIVEALLDRLPKTVHGAGLRTGFVTGTAPLREAFAIIILLGNVDLAITAKN